MHMKGFKVVTASEMARIEIICHDAGFSEAEFMENAGKAIAEATENFVMALGLQKTITIVVGKGNNGGDAFVAGRLLMEMGFSVTAYHPYSMEACTSLCRTEGEKFKKMGGKVSHVPDFKGVILDGLTGTGFKGKAEGVLAETIELVNGSNCRF